MVKKIYKHIEIVRSSVKGLSSMGKDSCDDLYELLSRHYSSVGISHIKTLEDPSVIACGVTPVANMLVVLVAPSIIVTVSLPLKHRSRTTDFDLFCASRPFTGARTEREQ